MYIQLKEWRILCTQRIFGYKYDYRNGDNKKGHKFRVIGEVVRNELCHQDYNWRVLTLVIKIP